MSNKVDSNFTGLRYALEMRGQAGVLPGEHGNPGTAVWNELEPNSYSDFGSDLKTTARSVITAGRQKKKGRVTDLDSKAGFQLDFTGNNLAPLLPVFMFADWHESSKASEITGVTAGNIFARPGLFNSAAWPVGGLVLAEGFNTSGNNGLKTISAHADGQLTVSETLTVETGADAGSMEGYTITVAITADVDNGYGTDKSVSYTLTAADDADTVGAALASLLAAVGVTATYTAGTDILEIDGSENVGDSTISVTVEDTAGATRADIAPSVEAPTGTASDPRDITMTPLAAPDVIEFATLTLVGFSSTAGDIDVDASDAEFPAFTSTVLDFTTLPLNPGQWIYTGGDLAASRFTNAGNNGYARIYSVAAHRLVFDKTQNTMVTEANTTKTVQLFFGNFIRNENDPDLIVTQSMQLERYVVAGYEYAKGNFGNEMTINLPTADKITIDMAFLSLDTQAVDVADRKPGSFPVIRTDPAAFNTSSDMIRLRASEQHSASPLFSFVQEASLKVSNNISTLKALGVLGAFDVTIGDFEVTGDMTAYFNDIAAVQAVRNSTSLSLDFVLAFGNRGWVFDVPLFTGDKGTLSVEKDKAVTIPVGVNAAEDEDYHATLMITWFPYLPSVATPQV